MKPAPSLIVLSALMGVSELVAQTAAVTVTPASVTVVAQVPAVVPAVVVGAPPNNVVVPATPAPLPGTAAEARLVNLSTRARVSAASPLITGFAISGTSPRTVLVRAAGPGLAAFGVTGALAATSLELRDATGAVLAENAGWGNAAALAGAFARAGAFPFVPGSADSAAVITLAPGSYTVQVQDPAGNGGVALAEIYDLSPPGDSRLVNVSTRTTVSAGGGEFISGFVLDGVAPRDFLLRGVGPGLAKFGVTGVLADPVLTLFDTRGAPLATNDNWSGTPSALASGSTSATSAAQAAAAAAAAAVAVSLSPTQIAVVATVAPSAAQLGAAAAIGAPVSTASNAAGAFPLDLLSNDAALVKSLAPGAYTVQVSGADITVPSAAQVVVVGSGSASGTTVIQAAAGTRRPAAPGIALLEIYELP